MILAFFKRTYSFVDLIIDKYNDVKTLFAIKRLYIINVINEEITLHNKPIGKGKSTIF